MRALLHNLPIVDDHDAVGVGDGTQAMGNHKGGAPLEQARQSKLDDALGLRVHAGGGFVQDQDARVGQQRAREGDQLALSHAEQRAALLHRRVIAVFQRHDELVRAHRFSRIDHLRVRGVQPPEQDVLRHRPVEQERVLQHDPHLAAQAGLGHRPQVVAVHAYAALGRVMEA